MKLMSIRNWLLYTGIFLFFSSCEKLLDVDVDSGITESKMVFSDDVTANAAMRGLYVSMLSSDNFAGGSIFSVTALCGISGGELSYYPNNVDFKQFQEFQLSSSNLNIEKLWQSLYYTIYQSNAIIEGVQTSPKLSEDVKNRLHGEALFIRAFSHFYLTNLFGNVPIILSTDYESNSVASRKEVSEVYESIKDDLLKAQQLLFEDYHDAERIQPNKSTATALLARVYLYLKDWNAAATESGKVIADGRYKLENDMNDAFKYTSNEAIWQLKPDGQIINTNEGYLFILEGPPTDFSKPVELSQTLLDEFEANDERLNKWVGTISQDASSFSFPYKYKMNRGGSSFDPPVSLTEYSMVFRFAEQLLIRAEANANLNNIEDAIADLDLVRYRANLPLISIINPGIGQNELLNIIYHEKRIEFFAEWGHWWFDLKRLGLADQQFSAVSTWQTTDQLYPIPQIEIERNPNIGSQNLGY